MANKTVNQLPSANTPLINTDKVLSSRTGIDIEQTSAEELVARSLVFKNDAAGSVYRSFNSKGNDFVNAVDFNKTGGNTIANLVGITPARDGVMYDAVSYYNGFTTPSGGGLFVWSSTTPKSQHNGGTIISPTVPWNGSQAALANFLNGVGETAPGGNGCWLRVDAERFGFSVFGAVGDGVVNDSQPVIKSLLLGLGVAEEGKTYNLGGVEFTINNSVKLICEASSKFINGHMRLQPTDVSKSVEVTGLLRIIDGSFRIQGSYDPLQADPLLQDINAITVVCDSVHTTNTYPTAGGPISLINIKNSAIGVLRADGVSGGSSGILRSRGILLNAVYDSTIDVVAFDGEFDQGVELDAPSSNPRWALCRTKIGVIRSNKPVSYPDFSGRHGVYFHNCYRSEVGIIQALGWGGDISSCADLKFRDNVSCKVGRSIVGRYRITAGKDYSFFDIFNIDNQFDDLEATIAFSSNSGTGAYYQNNVFRNLRAVNISLDNNELVERGLVFSGKCVLSGQSGSINVTPLNFENAVITLTGGTTFGGNIRFNAADTEFLSDVTYMPGATGSATKLRNVKVNGTLFHDAVSGASTHSVEFIDVFATGEIKTSSFGSRTINATWVNVTSRQNQPVGSFRPTNKIYKSVAYADAYFDSIPVYGTDSGTYLPTLTSVTNIQASTPYVCQYMRVGNVVTVSGRIAIDPTATGNTRIDISLPYPSNFAASTEAAGTAVDGIIGQAARVFADSANNRLGLQYNAVDTASRDFSFHVTYLVI